MTPAPAGPPPGTVRWRLRLAYDGAPFAGFAPNRGQRTVAGDLADALGRVARVPVTFTCAGRTDAGVHALDQVVHTDLPTEAAARLDAEAVLRSLNRLLAPSIVVREVGPAPEGFHARRSALSRRYRYLVLNASVGDPLLAPRAWHVRDPLDLRSMQAAADAVLGEHDFRSFCRRVPGHPAEEELRRRVLATRWSVAADAEGRPAGSGTGQPSVGAGGPSPLGPATGRLLAFEIEANAFCHRMVRSLVGTLVDVGRGRRHAADLPWILRSSDRGLSSDPAPAHGLTLVRVVYATGS